MSLLLSPFRVLKKKELEIGCNNGKNCFFIKTCEEVLVNDWQNQGINQFYMVYSDCKVKLKNLIEKILLMRTQWKPIT